MTEDELAGVVADLRSVGTDYQLVEAKRAKSGLPKSVRATISAFSNQRGGVILLGLDEERGFVATGVDDPGAMSAAVSNLCSDQMQPPVRPLVQTHEFEDVKIVTVEVAELQPTDKPCFYKPAGISNGSYVRVGDSDRRLTSYEVQVMTESRGQPRHDEDPIPGDRPVRSRRGLGLRVSRSCWSDETSTSFLGR
jgi:ATP-dependent DNA helicase RecG